MYDSLPTSRKELIEQRLAAGQHVVAAHLAKELGVSEHAVRRDLRALVSEGKCRRVYGGALPLSGGAPLAARLRQGADRKAILARSAAQLVKANETIFLDSGSTNLAIVSELSDDLGLTVATNSVAIAQAILDRGDINLHLIGGTVDQTIGGAVDACAVAAIQRFNFDRAYIGACAVSESGEVCVLSHADAVFKATVLNRSVRNVALITAEKVGGKAPYHVAHAKELELLILDCNIDAAAVALLKAAGCSIRMADGGPLIPC